MMTRHGRADAAQAATTPAKHDCRPHRSLTAATVLSIPAPPHHRPGVIATALPQAGAR